VKHSSLFKIYVTVYRRHTTDLSLKENLIRKSQKTEIHHNIISLTCTLWQREFLF